MPFGKHRDYNNEIQFVSKHFLNTTRVLSKEQNEDLNEITKKFRLDDKNKQGVKKVLNYLYPRCFIKINNRLYNRTVPYIDFNKEINNYREGIHLISR